MSRRWLVRVTKGEEEMAAVLRQCAGVEVCAAGEDLWLRGPCDRGAVERAMWQIPGERYVESEGKLVPWGRALPVAEGPQGRWVALAEHLRIVAGAPALPGLAPAGVRLRLERSHRERPAELLEVDAAVWGRYVQEVAGIRLTELQYALSSEGRVLIRGRPMPALPGSRLWLEAGMAVPCGWEWRPVVPAKVVAERLELQAGEMAVLAEDGSYEVVPEQAWVAASRSSVRLSLEEGGG